MTFIRAKEIPPGSGNWYEYEVKTIHEGRKVRQKVVRYLGRRGTCSTELVKHGKVVVEATSIPVAAEVKSA